VAPRQLLRRLQMLRRLELPRRLQLLRLLQHQLDLLLMSQALDVLVACLPLVLVPPRQLLRRLQPDCELYPTFLGYFESVLNQDLNLQKMFW
jgi:hypothetical protein